MTALEKMAKAMCMEDHGYDIWDDQAEKIREQYRRRSRAAVEALRNPPQYVYDELNRYCGGLGGANWSGAIDIILKEIR